MNAQNRIQYLDVARAIAIVSITFNHAVNRSFSVYQDTMLEYQSIPIGLSIIKVLLYTFSRIGVPLFLMITGALLLSRDYEGRERLERFVKHNWLQLLITTELWFVIMFIYKQLAPNSILHQKGALSCLLHFIKTLLFIDPVTMDSMWYMQMILCLYLMIPLFSVALKRIPQKYFILPIVIVTICSFVLPDINAIRSGFGMDAALKIKLDSANLFSMYAVYLLAGYFINNGIIKHTKTIHVLVGFLLSFALFAALQFWLYGTTSDRVMGYSSFLLLCASLFLFELLRRSRIKDGLSFKCSVKLAEISFGIYFVHICIMEGLEMILDKYIYIYI